MMRRAAFLLVALAVFAACGDDGGDGSSQRSTSSTVTTVTTVTTVAPTSSAADRVDVDVYFVDRDRFARGEEPYVRSVVRSVPAADPRQGALDALFAGPDPADTGLRLVASDATGARLVDVRDGIATVELVAGCDSGGSTLTVAAEIVPTMKQFEGITAVQILDPQHQTEDPEGDADSIPFCLEP
jgi:spore germination protein GerM